MHCASCAWSNQPLLNPHTLTLVCDLILGSLSNQTAKQRANIILHSSSNFLHIQFCGIITYGQRIFLHYKFEAYNYNPLQLGFNVTSDACLARAFLKTRRI